jgi:hypothetical protein
MSLLTWGYGATWLPEKSRGARLQIPRPRHLPGASLDRASSAKSQLLLKVTNIRSSEGACP